MLLAIRAGLMSRSEAIAAFGYDAEDVDREIAADNQRADDLDAAIFVAVAQYRADLGDRRLLGGVAAGLLRQADARLEEASQQVGREALATICELLGGRPLGVELAGAGLNRAGSGRFADYARLLAGRGARRSGCSRCWAEAA